MKYIFDFDDVLFHTTKNLRERIYDIYKENGVSQEQIKEYVAKEQVNGFSLKKLLKHFLLKEDLYIEIMRDNHTFVNQDLLDLIKKVGKENCFIVTYGDEEFQKEKIKSARIEHLFSKIFVVLKSKKEAVENICEQFKNEKVVFIDDKESHFQDLDFEKYPNLKTILYTGQDLHSLL